MQPQPELDRAQTEQRPPRRHVRHLYSVPIQIERLNQAFVRVSHGVTLDISEGGFAAVIEESVRAGETVRIALPLPSASLQALAVVRYATSNRSGFEFLNLNGEARQQIAAAAEMHPS